ncbi:MAG TPA: hypothetical protein VMJ10_32315 [Kofleriaceae bacterium]|nr:hypothetical protein [Kofleriaceae bacterium]
MTVLKDVRRAAATLDLRSVLFGSVLAACSSSPPANNSVSGTNAFTVATSVMRTKGDHCSSGVLASGKLDTLAVYMADGDACSLPYLSPANDLSHTLELQIATGGFFAADRNAANQPLVAGTTFPILNEQVDDEDLCSNVPDGRTEPAGIAMFQVCSDGTCAEHSVIHWATSGSITLSSVSATSATGTFNLALADNDSEPGGTLSGSFNSDACP